MYTAGWSRSETGAGKAADRLLGRIENADSENTLGDDQSSVIPMIGVAKTWIHAVPYSAHGKEASGASPSRSSQPVDRGDKIQAGQNRREAQDKGPEHARLTFVPVSRLKGA